MERFKSLLKHDPQSLATLLMVHDDLRCNLLQAIQDDNMNKAVIDFLKSDVCSVKVLEILLENSSSAIIGGLRKPNPTPFDMYMVYAIAYASGLIEAIRQYKI